MPVAVTEVTICSRRVRVRAAAVSEILALRHRELRPGRPRATAEFDGDREAGTLHFGAFLVETGAPVGCASFVARPWRHEPAYQVRGMATRADLVRHGVGTALLRFAETVLGAEPGPRCLWCNARLEAVAFYEKLGWAVVSPRFEIPDVGPHFVMVRRLPEGTPSPASSS